MIGSDRGAVRPETEAEMAEVVRGAVAAGQTLAIRGGGSRAGLAQPGPADHTVTTAGLTGVTLYEPGALTLVVRAGTTMAAVEAALEAEGQQLPFEPMDHRRLLGAAAGAEPTIGGATAVGASGPRRIQAGGLRDSLIGARFVNGAGEIVASGGRVMKNVTGYDLARAQAGAFGALGVLTEVAFKVLPKPEAAATLVAEGLSDVDAVSMLAAALGSPFDVTAAAHLPAGLDGPHGPLGASVTMVRLEGFADSVAYRAKALGERLKADVVVERDAAAQSAGWTHVRDAAPFAGSGGAVWRCSTRPSDGPALVAALKRAVSVSAFYDWGGGLVWLDVGDAPDAGAPAIRAAVAALPHGGRATLVRASDAARGDAETVLSEPPARAALEARVQAAFDPHGVFNPGLRRAAA